MLTTVLVCLQCEGAIPALSTIEMPMVSVLVDMELRGICLSKRVLGQQKPAMLRKLLQLEARAAAANGGEKFNLAAPGEVGKVRTAAGPNHSGVCLAALQLGLHFETEHLLRSTDQMCGALQVLFQKLGLVPPPSAKMLK